MRDQEFVVLYIRNLRIEEPVVTFTNLIVSFLCFYYFYQIHSLSRKSQTLVFFKLYFFLMGLATLLGGIFGHAFLYAVPFEMKLAGWLTSMVSIMLIERTAIEHTKVLFNKKVIRILRVINGLELATFMTLTIISLDFFFVEIHSGYGLMFVVLSLEGYLFYKTKSKSSKNMLVGVSFAAAAALIFMNHISLHRWFNYLAISHVLMAVATLFFYRGAIKISAEDEGRH